MNAHAAREAPEWTIEELESANLARRPLPTHLPRRRVVLSGLTAYACGRGGFRELEKVVTKTSERAPARSVVLRTVCET
jgi:transposase